MLDIIVLVKQVPDVKKVKFDRERGVIDRKSAPNELNPFDLNALEAAVQIKEELGEDAAKITALSMGPDMAEDSLKEALARGADEAILLSAREFAGSDTWATSLVLSTAIKKLADYDLILAGEKTVDGDTGQVGPQIAEFLDIFHAAYVSEIKKLDNDNHNIQVISELWQSSFLKTLDFPCLLTVTKEINDPRLPSIKDKVQARKAEITKWDYSALSDYIAAEEIGIKGSPTRIKNIEVAPAIEREGEVWRDGYEKANEKICELLQEKQLLGGE